MMRFAALVIGVLLVASVSIAVANVRGDGQHHGAQRHSGWMARNANPKDAWLYVSGTDSNNVLIYDLQSVGTPEIGAITNGINNPRGLSLDSSGTLYVANLGGSVAIYPAGATSPSLVITQGLTYPNSAVADSQGNVWVTNVASHPSINVYPPGQSVPSQTITDSLIQVPQQLLFDAAGDAFFADNTTGVSEIPVGTKQPVSLKLKELVQSSSNGLALDPANGAIFVSFGNFHNQLNVYAAGHVRPKHVLQTPTADSLVVATFRGRQDLFVPGSQTNEISVFRAGASTPFASFAVATQYTRSVAFKPGGVP